MRTHAAASVATRVGAATRLSHANANANAGGRKVGLGTAARDCRVLNQGSSAGKRSAVQGFAVHCRAIGSDRIGRPTGRPADLRRRVDYVPWHNPGCTHHTPRNIQHTTCNIQHTTCNIQYTPHTTYHVQTCMRTSSDKRRGFRAKPVVLRRPLPVCYRRPLPTSPLRRTTP